MSRITRISKLGIQIYKQKNNQLSRITRISKLGIQIYKQKNNQQLQRKNTRTSINHRSEPWL
ncbi:hypothetical protein HanRHA438_Chr14g0670261 [Helianthus annuus]|nr:hypothetical protein HanRHA438_Chr14g0670261 [Helianthus annuus]